MTRLAIFLAVVVCLHVNAASAQVTEYTDADAWKTAAGLWQGLAFDEVYPGVVGTTCLAGAPGPTLNLTGGDVTVRSYTGVTEGCALWDGHSTVYHSDGFIYTVDGLTEVEFSPPVFGFFTYYWKNTGTTVTMRLFDATDVEITAFTSGTQGGGLTYGHGFHSVSPVARIEFTSSAHSYIGAANGPAVGQTSLGTVTIPGYLGPSGETVELDFAVDYNQSSLYVDASAAPGGSGASWDDALQSLVDAIAAASAETNITTIHIAEGTYKPDDLAPGDRTATFAMVRDVALLGGFPAGGGARDPSIHLTVLSGDIGTPSDPLDNSHHVLRADGATIDGTLDGLVISDGKSRAAYPHDRGAGIWITDAATMTFNDCTFEDNDAQFGGGVFSEGLGTTVSFSACTFNNNTAQNGPAVDSFDGPLYTVDSCSFTGNTASFGGGALSVSGEGTVGVITGCDFTGNTGAYGGAAIVWDGASAAFDGCTFTGNTATLAGGALTLNTPFAPGGYRTYHFEGTVDVNLGGCPQFADVQVGDPFTMTFTVDTTVPPDSSGPDSAIYGDQSFISVGSSIDGVVQGPFDTNNLLAIVRNDDFLFDEDFFEAILPLVSGDSIHAGFSDLTSTALSGTAWPNANELDLANWNSLKHLWVNASGGGTCLQADITSVNVSNPITLNNCDFEGNVSAGDGGAIFALSSGANIHGSRFFDNTANGVGDANAPFGGGAIMAQDSEFQITGSTIAANTTTGTGPHDGGAILLIDGSHADLDNTILWGNTLAAVSTYHFEGTVTSITGSGTCPAVGDVEIGDPFTMTFTVDTTVPPDSSGSSFAVYGEQSFLSVGATIDGVAQGPFNLSNMTAFVSDEEEPFGFGDSFDARLPLVSASADYVRVVFFGSSNTVLSSTAWPTRSELTSPDWNFAVMTYGNESGFDPGQCLEAVITSVSVELGTAGDQILLDTSPFSVNPNTALVNYALVEGWTGAIPGVSTSGDDPLFTNIGAGDLTIGAGSPAIDAGDNDAAVGSVDLAGNPRFHDDTGTPDTGNGVAPIVDKGVFEFQGTTTCAEDTNGDGIVNVTDLLALLAAWGPCDAPCPPTCAADTNNDCEVNVTDLLALLAAWGSCN